MIIAIAFVCFAFGFLAAIAVATNPGKSKSDVAGLWNFLRLMRKNVSCILDKNNAEQLLPAPAEQTVKEKDGGLLSK